MANWQYRMTVAQVRTFVGPADPSETEADLAHVLRLALADHEAGSRAVVCVIIEPDPA